MATKVPIATKVPMATKSTITLKVQIAQNLTLAVWLHMKYGLVYVVLKNANLAGILTDFEIYICKQQL